MVVQQTGQKIIDQDRAENYSLLTVIGQQRGVSHGMKGITAFNNLAFADDLTILSEARRMGVPSGGSQLLLNTVEEFSNWRGIIEDRQVMQKVGGNDMGPATPSCTVIQGSTVEDHTEEETGKTWSVESWKKQGKPVINWRYIRLMRMRRQTWHRQS